MDGELAPAVFFQSLVSRSAGRDVATFTGTNGSQGCIGAIVAEGQVSDGPQPGLAHGRRLAKLPQG